MPRRTDAAEAIGARVETAVLGMGQRSIAAVLGRADAAVRGRIRRFKMWAEDVRRHFTVGLVAVVEDPVIPDPMGTPPTGVVAAVVATHRPATTGWPGMFMVSLWEFAGRALGGRLPTSPPTAN
ncbi:hypothetical protein ACFXKR_09425 [Streptomyces violascens]|uniref:hypothetical protein n=1 Tax=Streptomyces violascens TaxID=67381 RepID=UPI0036A44FFE